MNIIFKIITISLFFQTNLVTSQSDINYTLSSNQVIISDVLANINSSITRTGNTLTWVQNVNENVTTNNFVIESTSGLWDSSKSQGIQIHQLKKEGYTISFTLTGTQTGLSALLSIQKDEEQIQNYSFTITSITYQ